jgi:hypothetical protein
MSICGGQGRKLLPLAMRNLEMKTFEVGVILLVHARSVEDAQRTLDACIPSDLRVERKEVQYCEENLARFTLN